MSFVPSAYNKVVQNSLQFNNPVSESSLDALGAAVNGLLDILTPVGSIIQSMLTEAQFHTQLGISTTWVLADGRSVAGSLYNSVTGSTTIPDLRGVFTRGKNNGRADGNQNPDGDVALGTIATSTNISHNHAITDVTHVHNITSYNSGGTTVGGSPNQVVRNPINAGTATSVLTSAALTGIDHTNFAGYLESRPTNVTVNVFIRIN